MTLKFLLNFSGNQILLLKMGIAGFGVYVMNTRIHRIPLLFMVLSAALLFFVSGCSSMPEGNSDDGKRWFRMNRCNGCHGEKGIGGKGPVIAGLNLSYRQFKHKLRAPNSPVMPVFEQKLLSDQDAADIYLWLQSLDN